jgi:hypothetical protein
MTDRRKDVAEAAEVPGTDLEPQEAAELALADQFKAELDVDSTDLVVPILKVTQPLTREVGEGDAKPGEFINSLTGENFGGAVEFVVAGFYKGRFQVDRSTGEVLDSGAGTGTCSCHAVPYVECLNAEEQWKVRSNAGDIEWGKGPPISTTFNFLGFVVGSEMPVKLSLMRAQAKEAKKLLTLLKFRPAPWDSVYTINTYLRHSKVGDYAFQGVSIKQGRKATPDERQAAVALAGAIRAGNTREVGEVEDVPAGGETRAASEGKGGLDY